MALPLFAFGIALASPAPALVTGFQEAGLPLQAGPETLWMGIYPPTDQLDIAPKALGYPQAPGPMISMLGGGAVIAKGKLLLSVQGLTGGMAAVDHGTGLSSAWNLDLAGVVLEQRYPSGNWEVTAGLAAWLGSFAINLRDSSTGAYTRFDSRFPAGGLTGAVRWPTRSHICFFFRTGYFWLPASGNWSGSLAPAMTKNSFDLNTTFSQVGLDLLF